MPLKRVSKLGAGSYGVVYAASIDSHPKSDALPATVQSITSESISKEEASKALVAVKRNFKEGSVTWMGNLRELDIMGILSGHPYILNLIDVIFKDPFIESPMTPVGQTDFKNLEEDSIHFIIDYANCNLCDYLRLNSEASFLQLKNFAWQLLVGIEFMHSRGVTHRDLKTPNLLVAGSEQNPYLRICDFGMSQILSNDTPSTPGVTTGWYRAPEICCKWPHYTSKIDLWSIGCILFEMFANISLIRINGDASQQILAEILRVLPQYVPKETLDYFAEQGASGFSPTFNTRAQYNRSPYTHRMNLSAARYQEFNSSGGTLNELEDLLCKLLSFDPRQRLNATEALAHPFFSAYQDQINATRKLHPPVTPNLPYYRIYPCEERLWVMQIACSIFNRNMLHAHPDGSIRNVVITAESLSQLSLSPRKRLDLPVIQNIPMETWYSHRVLFHAIDLYDRYLEYRALQSNSRDLRGQPTELSRISVTLRFYVCLYMMYKYYSVMLIAMDWSEFTPELVRGLDGTPEASARGREAEDFERELLEKVCGFRIYRETLLEIPSHYGSLVSDTQVQVLLQHLANLSVPWVDGSVRSLYRRFASHQNTQALHSPPSGCDQTQTLYRVKIRQPL